MKYVLFVITLAFLLLLSGLYVRGYVRAEPEAGPAADLPYREVFLDLDTGTHDSGDREEWVAYDYTVDIPDAVWSRLHITDYYLGVDSYLRLTSGQDDAWQRLDSTSLPEWSNFSAYFNGGAVRIELVVAPGEKGIFAQIDRALVGRMLPEHRVQNMPDSTGALCGPDNRSASGDLRTGRLSTLTSGPLAFCTAWLISNGALLTAGHCVDADPDGDGPMVPDGVLDWTANTVVEFNVPASNANGTVVLANPNNQYPVDFVIWVFDGNDGDGSILGRDWAVFSVNPNANTRLLPHQVHGFYRIIDRNPGANTVVRVTGFGVDTTPAGSTGGENAQTRTNQTSTGTFVDRQDTNGDIAYSHRVDTTGANSGSPIIWEDRGYAIGIHTNGGCDDEDFDANFGTAFEVTTLQTTINSFPGANRRYVDAVQFFNPPQESGTVFRPFNTVAEGVASAPNGGTVSIVAGSYNEPMTLSRPMRLVAPVGTVTIGR